MKNILFLDIETVPQFEKYELLDEKWKKLWDKKCAQLRHSEDETPESLYNRAGIYAEFGKIVCISVGYLIPKEQQYQLRITSFTGDDESEILEDFFGLIKKSFNKKQHLLCAHNGKEFDYPYICRRAVVNAIEIPQILDISNKKPWEVNHLDTLQMWKFGDYKSYTSLDLLAALFDLPSPKDNLDGSQVMEVYYQEKDLKKIVEYCEKDVSTLVNVYLKMKNNAIINESEIMYIPNKLC